MSLSFSWVKICNKIIFCWRLHDDADSYLITEKRWGYVYTLRYLIAQNVRFSYHSKILSKEFPIYHLVIS